MQFEVVSGVFLPFALGFLMFALGLGLAADDFKRLWRQPKALLIGVVCHFVALPLICFLLVKLFGLSGSFAIGFMLVAACPTGSSSNLLTFLAHGDVALAVSFTAIASLVTLVTLPLIVAWSFAHFAAEGRVVQAPAGFLMANVFLLMGLPVLLGMGMRFLRKSLVLRLEKQATRLATLLFVLIVLITIIKSWPVLLGNIATLAPFAILLNVLMLAVGFGAATAFALPHDQAVTLGIETSVQNASLAMVMATTVIGDSAMAVPGVLYGVLMNVGTLLFVAVMRRRELIQPRST